MTLEPLRPSRIIMKSYLAVSPYCVGHCRLLCSVVLLGRCCWRTIGKDFRRSAHRTGRESDDRTQIVLDKKYQPGLLGVEGFSHVYVFWWFDKNDTPEKRAVLQVHPSWKSAEPAHWRLRHAVAGSPEPDRLDFVQGSIGQGECPGSREDRRLSRHSRPRHQALHPRLRFSARCPSS